MGEAIFIKEVLPVAFAQLSLNEDLLSMLTPLYRPSTTIVEILNLRIICIQDDILFI